MKQSVRPLFVFTALALIAAGTQTAAAEQDVARKVAFDAKECLADWTVKGDVAVDSARSRDGKSGALRVGASGRAMLNLREKDGAGKVEFWIYDDGSVPANPKASRLGPRWGLVQEDGRVIAPGILYASYLGGAEGYTASVCDGKSWFDKLIWLGINRAPHGWHKWTLDFRSVEGLQIFVDDKAVPASIDSAKLGLKGFTAFGLWGDEGQDKQQSVWLADLSITLAGSVTIPRETEANPYSQASISADLHTSGRFPGTIYTNDNAPAAPALESLPLKESVSQYGITWTFDNPSRVGRFINGDWYVVGPATVTSIDPKPLYGSEIANGQLDHMDKERPENERVRNGFMVNPPARAKVAYDSGVRNYFDPSLLQRLPVALKPGDSLVSTISMPKGLVLDAQLRNKIERGVEDSSPIRTAATLTCAARPQPADAFRPSFCDRSAKIYLARNLRRNLLPTMARTGSAPNIDQYIRFTQRPWVGTCFFGFEEPVENMPQYGLEYGRVSGISALLLCTDLPPEQKEPLLVNLVQIGIDLGGMIRSGHPGFQGFGGHGSGRKLPIVIAGLLLGDTQLAKINQSFPTASFGEDEQTAYGEGWTGAKALFTGHSGIDAATGAGRDHEHGGVFGPYEHTPPKEWNKDQQTSESYRRCCTSVGWVAQALALHLMHAEQSWSHAPFFDYVDRWMYEDDSDFLKTITDATGKDFFADFARQRQSWDPFVNEMWAKYRTTLALPIDGWKQPHDETYYKSALAKANGDAK